MEAPFTTAVTRAGSSIFDPVVCEIVYRWFCPPKGAVLDPFAGGSVRGIIAAQLSRSYVGVELQPGQIAANRAQAEKICAGEKPEWIEGDSRDLARLVRKRKFDLVFSCPPYADLEVYSDDPRDLSTLKYDEFIESYRAIIAASVGMLRDDRFACFVVGDVRGKDGFYRGFPWHTIQAFEDAGARLYNEAVLVTAVGSLPLRAGRIFKSGRKLGKTHQNVFVFCKGSPKKAVDAIGDIEFGEIEPPGDGSDAQFGEAL